MSDKIVLNRAVRDLEESPEYQPISKVRILAGRDKDGNQLVYEYGTDSGRTLDVENPLIWDETQGRQVAEHVYNAVNGYRYKPYKASGAIMDPAMEIGDAVSVGNIYSVLADVETTFSPIMSATIAAPEGSNIDHEYPYEASNSSEAIRDLQELRTSFNVEQGLISAYISEINRKIGTSEDGDERSILSRLTEVEMTAGGITAYSEETIRGWITTDAGTIANTEIENWASLNFSPDGVSTTVQSSIKKTFDSKYEASGALASAKAYTDQQIQPIETAYKSEISQTSREIQSRVAQYESKWDIPAEIKGSIGVYGYGKPSDYGVKASDYPGQYYVNNESGYLYKSVRQSNGTYKWESQGSGNKLTLLTETLSSSITQTAESINLRVDGLANDVASINITPNTISLSVSPSVDAYGAYTGGSDFTVTNGEVSITTENVQMHVNALNIDGTIYVDAANIRGQLEADIVKAGAYIDSPSINSGSISGGTIQGTKFSDPYSATYMTMVADSWSDASLWFGPESGSSPSLSNSYFRVRGYNNYIELDLGGTAFASTYMNSWRLTLGGVWDFSQCSQVIMPGDTTFP